MKLLQSLAVPILLLAFGPNAARVSAAEQEGLAIAIVHDTSGSMKEPVKDSTGKTSPKYLIANRALIAIADRIQAFATNGLPGSPRKIQAGLYVFQGNGPSAAIPFGKFDSAAFTKWARAFSTPSGDTPLGQSLNAAGRAVLSSGLSRKHVLIITDGVNTIGPTPAAVLAKLQQETKQAGTSFAVHFVAFDVDAKVFDGVKKLGATVVAASNESQLNTQLEFILEKKILLEDEEPPKK
jgi:hypothetical protein